MRVARECRGLPLALITVGHALRRENDIEHWRAALSELENSTESREGMQNQVFASLRFSYDRLKDDTARACFLYCALYPEDHLIDTQELIKYWVWEGLLRSSGSRTVWEGLLRSSGSRTVKKRSGVMILNELKSACMLESLYQDGSPNEYVKMHDLIRDMAILLSRENPIFMVKSGLGLRFPPQENEWSPNLVRVSLMRNDLGCLEYAPRCSNLCTLLLQYNSISKSICPGFFNHMPNLKLLDLSYTGIEGIPESLSILENLHTLLIRSCWKLNYVPTLQNLKELKVLDLSYSPIHRMPQGMEMLSNLQHLDLSTIISQFSFHILPNYRFLESLFLVVPWQCDVEPVLADTMENCSRLEVLETNFESMQCFDQYIRSDHWILLENFRLFVGYPGSSINTGQNSVVFSAVDIPERFLPICLPDTVCELEMSGCPDITYVPFSITPASSQAQLKRCRIKYCNEMNSVIIPELAACFSNLELLEIEGLRNLRQLCRETPAPGTLRLLQILHVTSCNDLETLIPFELVPYLQSLMELRIENCDRISEVIARENNSSGIFLPSLRILNLSSLPQLKQISSGAMICDSLSSLEVVQCPNLETVSFLTEMRPQLVCSLKQIKGTQRWWETVRMNHTSVTDELHHAFKQVAE